MVLVLKSSSYCLNPPNCSHSQSRAVTFEGSETVRFHKTRVIVQSRSNVAGLPIEPGNYVLVSGHKDIPLIGYARYGELLIA